MIALIASILLCQTVTGTAVSITDGDTIIVRADGKSLKVRLDGIDAPERRQAFGTAARDRLGDLVFGRTVTLKTKGTDRYGRTIAVVFVDRMDINYKLVAEGLAWHYAAYSRDKALADAEKAARAGKRGLWGDKSPVAPWEFRKRPATKKAA